MKLLALISSALLAAKEVAASCSSFTSTIEPYTQPGRTRRVSKILHCSPGSDCEPLPKGIINVPGYVNISGLSHSDIDSIFETVQDKAPINTPFPPVACARAGGLIYRIPKGQTGFIGYTPELLCVKGFLDNCNDGPVNDHTYITACAPTLVHGHDRGYVNGTSALVLTNEPPNNVNPALKVQCQYNEYKAASAGLPTTKVPQFIYLIAVFLVALSTAKYFT